MRHWAILGLAALALAGCHTDMWVQPKVTDFDEDDLGVFKGGTTARPIPEGAVARGWEKLDSAKYTGFEGDKYTNTFPSSLSILGKSVSTADNMGTILKRGRERYNIYCSNCHGATGDGKGMITQRGLVLRREPPSYHTDRLRNMPIGYFYDVVTNGYGIMYSQASRLNPDDRWAVIAYLRALQLSQNAPESALTRTDLEAIQNPESAMKSDNHASEDGHGGH